MDKKTLRIWAKNRLIQKAKSAHIARSRKSEIHLKKLLQKLKPKSVLIYMPLGFEADIYPLIKSLRRKITIYAPFMEDVSFKMVLFRLPLTKQKLGVKAPNDSKLKIKKVDVMIVPAIAVDAAFRRVGFGKGMYDRFFVTLQNKPIVIFVQPFFVRSNSVVTDDFDIAGDYLVCSSGITKNRGTRYDNRTTSYRIHHR